jgi:hypothetical protein
MVSGPLADNDRKSQQIIGCGEIITALLASFAFTTLPMSNPIDLVAGDFEAGDGIARHRGSHKIMGGGPPRRKRTTRRPGDGLPAAPGKEIDRPRAVGGYLRPLTDLAALAW